MNFLISLSRRIVVDIYTMGKSWFLMPFYSIRSRLGKKSGINLIPNNPQIIISLTSIPSRIKSLHLCIETLLGQSLKPDKIVLWLDSKTLEKGISKMLKKQQTRGLSIRDCKDIGPHTKLIYTLKENPEAIIVTADDDFFYPKDWLEKLVQAYYTEPEYIHCYRAHLITKNIQEGIDKYSDWLNGENILQGPSMWLFPTGCSGVIYPPNIFPDEIFNSNVFQEICPTSDDIWFKAMSLLNGIQCKKIYTESKLWINIPSTQRQSLYQKNCLGENDSAIKKTFGKYKIYDLLK